MFTFSLKRARDQRAFTLIELLVVVLMVGILLAVALPSFLGQKDKAYDTDAKVQLRTAYSNGHDLYVEFGQRYPADLGDASAKDSFIGRLSASEPALRFTEGGVALDVTGSASLDGLFVDTAYAADAVEDPSNPALKVNVLRLTEHHVIYANRSRSGTIWCANVRERANSGGNADYRLVKADDDGAGDDDAEAPDRNTCFGHDVTQAVDPDPDASPTPTPTPTPTTSPVDCLTDDGDLYARCGANRAMVLMRECYAQTLDYGVCDGDAVMQLFDEGYFGVTVVSAPPNGYYIEALSATGNTYSITGSDADDGVGTCTAPSGPDPDDPGPGCVDGAWLPDAYTGPMPLGPADFDADALPVLNALRSAATDCYADTGDMTWGCAVWDLQASYGFDPGDFAGMVDVWAMGPDMYQAFIVSNSGTTFTRWILDAGQPSADDMRVCDQADYGLCQPDGTFSE